MYSPGVFRASGKERILNPLIHATWRAIGLAVEGGRNGHFTAPIPACRYGYPYSHIVGDTMYVIYSVCKEDIWICRFRLGELD